MGRVVLVNILLLLSPMLCFAQEWVPWGSASNYVNITEAKVEQLSNAVRVTLVADGVLVPQVSDWEQFIEYRPDTGDYRPRESKRFSVNLLNARSQIGRFVDVAKYPVSHLTLSVPTEAQEGVGLVVALRLYVPARIQKLQTSGYTQDLSDWLDWLGGSEERVDLVLSESGREAIITVHTAEHYDVEAAKAALAPPPHEELVVEGSSGACRVRALNAPFQRIMEGITAATGVEVMLSPDVDKRLTVNLPPMPVRELLGTLCRAACLDIAEQGGAFRINQGTVADAASYWASSVRRIPLHNISVDDALRILPVFMLKYVKTDAGSNMLVASGPPVLLNKIAADLAAIDRPGRQIRVSVLLVEVLKARQAERALSALVRNGRTLWGVSPVEGRISVGVVPQSLRDVELSLASLAQRGVVRTEVRPQTTVLSGREARVFLGKQVFYTVQYGGEGWSWVEFEKLDVGVNLRASPWTGDGVSITVPFDVSADVILSRDAKGLPTVGRQRARGSLRIRSGETIVFSGLRSREASRERQGVASPGANSLADGIAGARWTTGVEREVVVCLSAETIPAPPPAEQPHATEQGPDRGAVSDSPPT